MNTLSPAMTVGALTITAYRWVQLTGNELQLDLMVSWTGSGSDKVVSNASIGNSAYSTNWNKAVGTWSY